VKDATAKIALVRPIQTVSKCVIANAPARIAIANGLKQQLFRSGGRRTEQFLMQYDCD
jgi:hypothetical protein